MVLVIDNASFHTSAKAKKLVEAVGCRIIFLPPYTPQFNPIEHWWSGIKDLIKKVASKIKDFYEAAIKVMEMKCVA
jgi:transposase